MTDMLITNPDVITRLNEIAQRQQRSVNAVLKDLLASYLPEDSSETTDAPPGSMAALIQSGQQAGLHKEVDTSNRSRQILREIYDQHLNQSGKYDHLD